MVRDTHLNFHILISHELMYTMKANNQSPPMATDIWKDLPTSLKKSKCVCISEETYTLSAVKPANELIFLHAADHATCENKFFLFSF